MGNQVFEVRHEDHSNPSDIREMIQYVEADDIYSVFSHFKEEADALPDMILISVRYVLSISQRINNREGGQ